jgi:long-chain acyl-CoA synthetase
VEKPWLKHYDEEVPTHIDYPRIPLYQQLDESASSYPERPCTRFFGKELSYADMKELSDHFAASLRDLGVKKADRVALLLPNSPQFVIAYYGLLKAGAVIVPLNPLYTARELAFHFDDSGTETAVTIPMFLDKAISLWGDTPLKRVVFSRLADFMPAPLSFIQGFRENRLIGRARKGVDGPAIVDMKDMLRTTPRAPFQPEAVDPEEMAVLIYSGGTTGVAKGIMLSHFNLVANSRQIAAWGGIAGQDRLLAVLPFFHGFGMSVNMNAPVLAGSEITVLPPFNAKDVAKAIEKYRPTFFIAVPTMFVALSNLPDIDRFDFSSLKGIFVGAAPLTQAIKDEFESKTSGRMIEGYGLTEAVTAIMANPYRGLHKLASIGIPFPDVVAKIVSLDDGHDLPPGEPGEIVLQSPTVMLGYHNLPEQTADALREGWLYTGDIGHMDEDGYFYITDRKKELIIIGGFNVFPREIDELIYKHPKVREGICVGLPDPYKGERIKVYAVLKEGERASEEEFIEYFRENLVSYKVPSEIEFRTALPKSTIGKILRRALREEELHKTTEKKESLSSGRGAARA